MSVFCKVNALNLSGESIFQLDLPTMPAQDMMMKLITAITVAIMTLVLSSNANADSLKIVDIDGKVYANYTQEGIANLGTTTIETTTPWTDGVISFTGVYAKKLMEEENIKEGLITAIALDDYAAELTWEDIKKHNALIATHMNGEQLVLGEKGPFWIVFDFDSVDKVDAANLHSKAVWHLVEIEIE